MACVNCGHKSRDHVRDAIGRVLCMGAGPCGCIGWRPEPFPRVEEFT